MPVLLHTTIVVQAQAQAMQRVLRTGRGSVMVYMEEQMRHVHKVFLHQRIYLVLVQEMVSQPQYLGLFLQVILFLILE